MKRETVLERDRGGVRVLTFHRPEARNAFNDRQYRELKAALDDAADDAAVRVVVLTGAPGAFSAGQDLGEMAAPPTSGGEHPFGLCIDRVIDFDKPLLAAVNGVGVGLGLTLLLHCDVVYIARGARLRVPFLPLGVVPEAASSYLLPVRVGPQRAAELLFAADWVGSAEAVEMGLALRECEPDALLPAMLELAERIAGQPPEATRQTKRLLQAPRIEAIRAARAREDRAFQERIGTPENLEAIRAFFEKRRPDSSKI